MSESVVEFTGSRAAHGPLTWGQRSIWLITHWLPDGDPYFNLPWTLSVHGKPDLPAVLRALGLLLERHESLRTTWSDTPAGPVQRVAGSGSLTVGLHDAGAARPREVAAELAKALAATGFDYGAELPVRCAIVMADGRPKVLAFAFSHLAVDAWAMDVMAAEWPRLLAGETLPPPAWQPLDLAAAETSEEGTARGERALRHWRAALDRTPREQFAVPAAEPENPRFVKLGMESAAVAAAATELAERWSVSTTSVLVGASAALLAQQGGHGTVAMQFIVANRHDRRAAALVATMVQDGVFVMDLPRGTFEDAVRAAHRQSMSAYRHAHYDPVAQRALLKEAGPAPAVYFNDVRTTAGWPNIPAGTPAELTGRTRLFSAGAWSEVDATIFLSTGPATHTCQLYLLADTAHLPRTAIEAILRGLEALLVRAVAEDVPLGDRIPEAWLTEEMTCPTA